MVITVSASGDVSVTVNAAVRWAPVLAATLNAIVPSPEPVAPWVMVRNEALLTAPQVQLEVVRIEIVPEPPAAEKLVVVLPVITSHPPLGDDGLSSHATVANNSADAKISPVRVET
jgi:hypothetical protein